MLSEGLALGSEEALASVGALLSLGRLLGACVATEGDCEEEGAALSLGAWDPNGTPLGICDEDG